MSGPASAPASALVVPAAASASVVSTATSGPVSATVILAMALASALVIPVPDSAAAPDPKLATPLTQLLRWLPWLHFPLQLQDQLILLLLLQSLARSRFLFLLWSSTFSHL